MSNKWIPCSDWHKLPVGTWLVKIDCDDDPYHIAYVVIPINGKIIAVGYAYSFDVEGIIAYCAFDKYEAEDD